MYGMQQQAHQSFTSTSSSSRAASSSGRPAWAGCSTNSSRNMHFLIHRRQSGTSARDLRVRNAHRDLVRGCAAGISSKRCVLLCDMQPSSENSSISANQALLLLGVPGSCWSGGIRSSNGSSSWPGHAFRKPVLPPFPHVRAHRSNPQACTPCHVPPPHVCTLPSVACRVLMC